MKFRKNFHKAKKCSYKKICDYIEKYPELYGFNAPKYLLFIREMLENGWRVKLYKVKVSKYVFIYKPEKDLIYKIRFSNHKPIKHREAAEDCDFYVGISHYQVSKTEEVMEKINQLEQEA